MENPLKSLKIENYYSYLLVLGGFILIISLIYEPKVISQSKLTTLSLITIIYGLVEWIRESNFQNYIRHINQEFLVSWEEESAKKDFTEIMDKSWDANFRKKFMKEHGGENLIPKYQFKTWIFFIIYLFLMTLIFYFL